MEKPVNQRRTSARESYKKASSSSGTNTIFFAFFAVAVMLMIASMLIALIICVDRSDELFNELHYQGNWRDKGYMYQNAWEPFKNMNFLQCVQAIPRNLYIAVAEFPTAFLVGLVFFPLLVFVVPAYEAMELGVANMLLQAWLPFLLGVALFVIGGLIAERGNLEKLKANAPPVKKKT